MRIGLICALLGWSIISLTQDIKVVLFPFQETLLASRIDSVVMPHRLKIGESFKKGEVICSLDSSQYELEVKKMTNHYDFAKAVFEDKKRLYANKFTSDFELKKAEFDMNVALFALSEANLNLSFCSIIAPFDGKITEFVTKEYELCRPGQPIIRIINDSKLLATANIPMRRKELAKVGNKISIKLIDNQIVPGFVYEVAPQADHRSETVRIKILIENQNGKITSGITGVLQYGK